MSGTRELDYEELPDHTWEFIDLDPERSEAIREQYNKKLASPKDMEIGDGLGLRLFYIGLRGELQEYRKFVLAK